jgi:hypothetical protein
MNNETPNSADQVIQCRDCPNQFTFTAGEQAFFAERQFTPPTRCKPCRQRRKAEKEARDGGGVPAPVVVQQAAPAYEEYRKGGGGGGRKKGGGGGGRRRDSWDD